MFGQAHSPESVEEPFSWAVPRRPSAARSRDGIARLQAGCTSRLQVASWPSRACQARRAGRIWPAASAAGVRCLLTRAPWGRKEPTDRSVLPPRWGFSAGEGHPPWARAHGQILPALQAWHAMGSLLPSKRCHAPARGAMTPVCCPTGKRYALSQPRAARAALDRAAPGRYVRISRPRDRGTLSPSE